jgi:DNA-binding transcriptional MerR regulator
MMTTLEADTLRYFEGSHPQGATSIEIMAVLAQMGIRVSEATLRKYVQLGLLPRSRRVGARGRHQGSWGLYPPWTARQVVEVKRLLAEGKTIQDIAAGYASIFARCKEAGEALQAIKKRLEALRSRDSVDRRKVDELLDMIERAANLTGEVAEKAVGQADFVEIAI